MDLAGHETRPVHAACELAFEMAAEIGDCVAQLAEDDPAFTVSVERASNMFPDLDPSLTSPLGSPQPLFEVELWVEPVA